MFHLDRDSFCAVLGGVGASRRDDDHLEDRADRLPSKVGTSKGVIKPTVPGIQPTQIKIHVLSRYDLRQVEITCPLGKLKAIKSEAAPDEALLAPGCFPRLESQREPDRSSDRQFGLYGGSIVHPVSDQQLSHREAGWRRREKFEGRLNVRSSNGSLFFAEELPLKIM